MKTIIFPKFFEHAFIQEIPSRPFPHGGLRQAIQPAQNPGKSSSFPSL